MHRISVCVVLGAALSFATACSSTIEHLPVYKTKVRQGNFIDQASVDALRVGMSRQEVQARLGTPLLTDPLHMGRWDYVYLYRPGTYDNGEAEQRRVTLFFDRDTLARIETGG